ncbi:MAG: hypothetical protein ABW175_12205 [Bradyrhizobium sp.]
MASLIDHCFGFGGKTRDHQQEDTRSSMAVSGAAPVLPVATQHYTHIEPREFLRRRQATPDGAKSDLICRKSA